MSNQNILIVSPGKNGQVTSEYGEPLTPPKGWEFLPAGDAGITRKVTAQGKYWRVQVKKGRRTMSKGVWAPAATIANAKQTVTAVRQTDRYQKKRTSEIIRREKKQVVYQGEFFEAVVRYLNFHSTYQEVEQKMAQAITDHAIPVGSGTVARTQRIPVEERAARAVIAWMRHQTTAYDNMKIARIKGERRAVRRELAQRSVQLLNSYRKGQIISKDCPLWSAIHRNK
jgi:hypothetical protein